MKNPFKKVAALCVTAYAKLIYDQAVELAEGYYKMKPDMYYVISDPTKPKKLICINKDQFLELRHKFGIPSKALPISELKNTCWYHTKNISGKDGLTERDLTIRKLAFCRDLLLRAKLA